MINQQAVKLTDKPVSRVLKLGSDIRVSNGRYFTDSPRQSGNLQLTLTEHLNIGPDSPKMHSYRHVGSNGNTAQQRCKERGTEVVESGSKTHDSGTGVLRETY